MNHLENRIANLERQSGMGQFDHAFAASLDNEDRDFYLRMRAREAAHPCGFDGVIKTMDEGELTRYLSLLLVRLDGADLDDETRENVAESKRRLAAHMARRPALATA